jgi:hypothetical protein
MIKQINLSNHLTVNGKPATYIGPFSEKEITNMVNTSIVDVYKDDIHVARMSIDDYHEYSKTFGVSVEDAAYHLLQNKRDELQKKYPDSPVQSVIGYILSKKLYNQK